MEGCATIVYLMNMATALHFLKPAAPPDTHCAYCKGEIYASPDTVWVRAAELMFPVCGSCFSPMGEPEVERLVNNELRSFRKAMKSSKTKVRDVDRAP